MGKRLWLLGEETTATERVVRLDTARDQRALFVSPVASIETDRRMKVTEPLAIAVIAKLHVVRVLWVIGEVPHTLFTEPPVVVHTGDAGKY